MSKVFIEESTLTAIGNAIRNKTGETALIAPLDMPTEINGISTGGGTLPEEAFNITGDCSDRFKRDGWNWFINNYGSQVTTNNITNCENMFYYNNKLTTIPFSINCKPLTTMNCTYMFYSCTQLTALPEITVYIEKMDNMFSNCYCLREIPDSYLETFDFSHFNATTEASASYIFAYCYSLRKIPSGFLKKIYGNQQPSYKRIYNAGFQNCYSLDEIIGIPVDSSVITSNIFTITFYHNGRAKNIIFDTNEDGTAKTAQWKNQVIELQNVGYTNSLDKQKILGYNSGITADKEVKDDATYVALKNDPDWFTEYGRYSRYNKTSAIATINSLPDTSAYIAANGGTNTIKFVGVAGSATDGGAINTMTEEQIAVATAKGWTVTFV